MKDVDVRQVLGQLLYFIICQEEDHGVIGPQGGESLGVGEVGQVGGGAVDGELGEDDAVVAVTGRGTGAPPPLVLRHLALQLTLGLLRQPSLVRTEKI